MGEVKQHQQSANNNFWIVAWKVVAGIAGRIAQEISHEKDTGRQDDGGEKTCGKNGRRQRTRPEPPCRAEDHENLNSKVAPEKDTAARLTASNGSAAARSFCECSAICWLARIPNAA
jgi:hypothetical protein